MQKYGTINKLLIRPVLRFFSVKIQTPKKSFTLGSVHKVGHKLGFKTTPASTYFINASQASYLHIFTRSIAC